MAILGKFLKQPVEVQDYDISFVDWLAAFPDTAASHTVIADDGITLGTTTLTGGIVKVWLSGGITGTAYKITATIVTSGGRTKQDEILVKVKEF
jgi:hypothetical protein